VEGKTILKWLPREAEYTVLKWIQPLGALAFSDKPFGFEKESRQFLDHMMECIHYVNGSKDTEATMLNQVP
jgi:hypothetical protein